MKIVEFLVSHIHSHSVAGIALVGGFVVYSLVHPEAFTPASYTECACGFLAALSGTSAAKAYSQHKMRSSVQAPESQPRPLSPTNLKD